MMFLNITYCYHDSNVNKDPVDMSHEQVCSSSMEFRCMDIHFYGSPFCKIMALCMHNTQLHAFVLI